MTARIAGFVTREDAGLSTPKSVSRNITPEKGGLAVHYGGPRQSAADPGSDHAQCVKTWKAWETYHRKNNWVDIAYNGGVCNHGFAFAGRGFGVRSGANGTNAGNQNFFAVAWVGGEGQTPTQEAFDAMDWWLQELRKRDAGDQVRPHNYFKATACAGPHWDRYSLSRHDKAITTPPKPSPTPPPSASNSAGVKMVKELQSLLEVGKDGKWGPLTDRAAKHLRAAALSHVGWPNNRRASYDIRRVQGVIDTKTDGIWGPKSQAALESWVKMFQKVLGVRSDGLWGPKTETRFQALRRRYLNRY